MIRKFDQINLQNDNKKQKIDSNNTILNNDNLYYNIDDVFFNTFFNNDQNNSNIDETIINNLNTNNTNISNNKIETIIVESTKSLLICYFCEDWNKSKEYYKIDLYNRIYCKLCYDHYIIEKLCHFCGEFRTPWIRFTKINNDNRIFCEICIQNHHIEKLEYSLEYSRNIMKSIKKQYYNKE